MRTNNAFIGKASTGKSQNESKHCAEQKTKNSKPDERPSQRRRRDLLTGISRRMVRQRNEDKSQYRVKQREKGAERRHTCDHVMKDRQ